MGRYDCHSCTGPATMCLLVLLPCSSQLLLGIMQYLPNRFLPALSLTLFLVIHCISLFLETFF